MHSSAIVAARHSSSTRASSAILVDRVHRELTDEETQRIAQTYHAWRGTDDPLRNPHSEVREYADVPGFCKSATTDEIAAHGYVLTPGRYVGAEEVEDEGEPFEEKMERLKRLSWKNSSVNPRSWSSKFELVLKRLNL